MFGIVNLTTYIVGVVVAIILPGPNSLFCLTSSGQYGVKIAYRAIIAVLIGDCVLLFLASSGAATLMLKYPIIFASIKTLGGLYLGYLGLSMLKGAIFKWLKPPMQTEVKIKLSSPHVFKRALLLSLLNPKAILFSFAFFVQFVDVNYPYPALSFLILALILQLISFIYLNIVVFSGAKLVVWFSHKQKLASIVLGAVGLLFLGFAVSLFSSSIT